MPAYGTLLDDTEIWQLTVLLKNAERAHSPTPSQKILTRIVEP